jgi:hypothetical protein
LVDEISGATAAQEMPFLTVSAENGAVRQCKHAVYTKYPK